MIQQEIINWFTSIKRSLPWRDNRTPYSVWVSEIMLQQTQVDTVVPYFNRWMSSFPDVVSLAQASEEEVMHHWAGLGYYRRARMLHSASKKIVNENNSELPNNYNDWLKVLGVGSYTAAAISSMCFEEPVPVVDGNVKRVVARLNQIELPANAKELHKLSEEWGRQKIEPLPEHKLSPGMFNEGVMELGATICTPRLPKCSECPVSHFCTSFSKSVDPQLYPKPAIRKKWKELALNYVWYADEDKCALVERREGWNVGLWEPPTLDQWSGEVEEDFFEVKHTITNHKITAKVFLAKDDLVDDLLTDSSSVPLSGVAKKIIRLGKSYWEKHSHKD